jgi:predicted transcriptional regulator of viral defense system
MDNIPCRKSFLKRILSMPTEKLSHPVQAARSVIESHGGVVRTAEAIRAGIHPRTLYAMRDEGLLETISRGIYRLADLPPMGNPDLIGVAKRAPDCVICLISALSFHELTTQIPHEVYMPWQGGKRVRESNILLFGSSGFQGTLSAKASKSIKSTIFLCGYTVRRNAGRYLSLSK